MPRANGPPWFLDQHDGPARAYPTRITLPLPIPSNSAAMSEMRFFAALTIDHSQQNKKISLGDHKVRCSSTTTGLKTARAHGPVGAPNRGV